MKKVDFVDKFSDAKINHDSTLQLCHGTYDVSKKLGKGLKLNLQKGHCPPKPPC